VLEAELEKLLGPHWSSSLGIGRLDLSLSRWLHVQSRPSDKLGAVVPYSCFFHSLQPILLRLLPCFLGPPLFSSSSFSINHHSHPPFTPLSPLPLVLLDLLSRCNRLTALLFPLLHLYAKLVLQPFASAVCLAIEKRRARRYGGRRGRWDVHGG
jgi:hypothetical protein